MVIQYILILTIFIFLFIIAYIKLKYPFWNNQPVYHNYDLIRRFYKEPFVINQYTPNKTKFYDPLHVETFGFRELDSNKKKDCINSIQCFYLNTDKIIHTMNNMDLNALLSGQTYSSFVSLYYEKQYIQSFDLSGGSITKTNVSLGTITSRHLNFWYINKYKNKNNFIEMPIYFLDYLCVNRNKDQTTIFRKLMQSHEHNQRCLNNNICVSLIKKRNRTFFRNNSFCKI